MPGAKNSASRKSAGAHRQAQSIEREDQKQGSMEVHTLCTFGADSQHGGSAYLVVPEKTSPTSPGYALQPNR
jgi:hypothetical protein